MVAPIPFLERLTPGVFDHNAVRPALPPRFAAIEPEGPFRDPPSDGTFGDRLAVAVDQPEARPVRDIGREIPPQPPREYDRAPLPGRLRSPAILPVPLSRAEPADQPISSARRAEEMSPPGPATLPSPSGNGPGFALGRSNGGHGSGAHTIVGREADFDTPATPLLIDTRPPLREPIARQRAASQSSLAPTEVHVTIDRIEVRAPASATGGATRPISKPRAGPSLSLADYLRQRAQVGKRGGAG